MEKTDHSKGANSTDLSSSTTELADQSNPSSSSASRLPSNLDETVLNSRGKPYVGETEAFGMVTRNKKGSNRPPDIPGVVWSTLTAKSKRIAI